MFDIFIGLALDIILSYLVSIVFGRCADQPFKVAEAADNNYHFNIIFFCAILATMLCYGFC